MCNCMCLNLWERHRRDTAKYDTESLPYRKADVTVGRGENCYRKPRRWQEELYLSLFSLIRLPVLATSVTCYPTAGTGSRAEQAFKLSRTSIWNFTKACFFILRFDFFEFFFFLSLASSITLKKCFHLLSTTLSIHYPLKQLGQEQAACHFPLSGKLGVF